MSDLSYPTLTLQSNIITQTKDPSPNINHSSLKNSTNKVITQTRKATPYQKKQPKAEKTQVIDAPEGGRPTTRTEHTPSSFATTPESPTTNNGDFPHAASFEDHDQDEIMDNQDLHTFTFTSTLTQQEHLTNLANALEATMPDAFGALVEDAYELPGFEKAEAAFSKLLGLFEAEYQSTVHSRISQLTRQIAFLCGKIESMDENAKNAFNSQNQQISQIQLANAGSLREIKAQNQKITQIQLTTTDNLREIKAMRLSLASTPQTTAQKSQPNTYTNIAKSPSPSNPANNPPPKTTLPPSNPKAAHHPSRLAIQFLPDGIPEGERRDPIMIVETVNRALEQKPDTRHLKVVAAKFNNQGNLILSTRADQKAAELLACSNLFIHLIDCGYRSICREDKRWFKIQVDGISTTCTAMDHTRRTRTADEVHNELAACNPVYQEASGYLTTTPRWMRTLEEIRTTPISSIVFAVDNEDHAKRILGARTLAAFGRHCTMRAYQDHPPVPQCKNCWSLDHKQDKCTLETSCRLCAQPHHELEHDTTPCNTCPTIDPNDMNTTHDTCTHHLNCSNCIRAGLTHDIEHPADSRRCPTRLHKYGSTRIVEKKAMKSANPWKTTPQRTKRTPKQTLKAGKLASRPTPTDPTNTSLQSSIHNPSPTTEPTPTL